jgi:hypothetical protein
LNLTIHLGSQATGSRQRAPFNARAGLYRRATLRQLVKRLIHDDGNALVFNAGDDAIPNSQRRYIGD